jgi:hypothetical protein
MFAQIVKRGFHPTRQSAARLTTLVAPKRHLPTQLLSRPLQQQQQHHHQQQRTNGVVSLFPTLHQQQQQQQQQQRFSSTPSTSDSPPPTTSTAFPGDGQTSSGAAAAAAGSAAAGGSGGIQQTSTAQKVKVKIKAKKKIQIIDENIEIMNTELFPEGVPEHLTKELKHLNHPDVASWVKRKLTDDIVRRLEARVSLEKQDKKEYDPDLDLNEGVVVLAGTREVGKSVVLCQVVQWARNNGWIVLYSPNSGSLLRSGVQIYPSRHNEGYFDQPDIAGPLLANFRKAHARQLNKLPYQGEPRPTYLSERKRKEDVRKEKTGKSGDLNAVTLLDVVDHGLLGLGGSDAATSYRDLREQLSIVSVFCFVVGDSGGGGGGGGGDVLFVSCNEPSTDLFFFSFFLLSSLFLFLRLYNLRWRVKKLKYYLSLMMSIHCIQIQCLVTK